MNLLCILPRWLGGDHKWRAARKNESPDFRYCRRCPETIPVKHRKPARQDGQS